MASPTLLAGFPQCSETLPVDQPVEEYVLEQFMPILGESAGKTLAMGIPLPVAMPNYMALAKAQLGSSASAVMGALQSSVVSPNAAWSVATVRELQAPRDVHVADVSRSLLTGEIEVSGHKLDLYALGNVAEGLAAGRTVEVDLRIGEEAQRHRFVPLVKQSCDIPAEIAIRRNDISEVLKSGLLSIPGRGYVQLPQRAVNSLTRDLSSDGYAQVQIPNMARNPGKRVLIRTGDDPPAGRELFNGRNGYQSTASPMMAVALKQSPAITIAKNPANTPKLPHFPFMLHVPIIQTWTLIGYTRGGLINTFALAPQEELVIEVFTWDRRKTSVESTTSYEAEFATESGLTNKVTFESLMEAKRSNGWQDSFGVSGSIPNVPIQLNADFSISDKTDTTNKKTLQDITEATRKSSSKIKSSRQTKVTESSEIGREDRVTRRIRNPNIGRILHLDCFEILANYEVSTEYDFAGATLCIAVDYIDLLSTLVPLTLVAFEGLLYAHVPERLQSGFASARKLAAWQKICSYACDSACNCAPTTMPGNLPIPAASSNPYEGDVTRAIGDLVTATNRLKDANGDDLAKAVGIPAAGYANLAQDVFTGFERNFRAFLYRNLVLERTISRFWNSCLEFAQGPQDPQSAATLIGAADVQVTDLLNGAAAYLGLGVSVIGLVADLIFVRGYGAATPFMIPHAGFDDMGLETAVRQLRTAISGWQKVEDERKVVPQSDPNAGKNTKVDDTAARRSTSSEYSAEALAEADVDANALINYIQANRSFYRSLIWRALDPNDRMRFLGLFDELAKFGTPNVLGFVGDKMAVEFDLTSDVSTRDWMNQNVLNRKLEAEKRRVVLPVSGVNMQSRVDQCDALEPYLVQSRDSELRRQAAVANQEEFEAERRGVRIKSNDLDDPKPVMPVLKIDMENKS